MFKTQSAANLRHSQDLSKLKFQNSLKYFSRNDILNKQDLPAQLTEPEQQSLIESVYNSLSELYGNKIVNKVLQKCMEQKLVQSASMPFLSARQSIQVFSNQAPLIQPMPRQRKPQLNLMQANLEALEEQVAKVAAWKGGEPLMTRDPDMQHILIKNQLKLRLQVADVIKQKTDCIVCVSNKDMNAFSSSSAEIINSSGIQSRLAYRHKVYGQLANGYTYISDSGRLKNAKSLMQVSLPVTGTCQNREQELESVRKSMVAILECARINEFRTIVVPLLKLQSANGRNANYESLADLEIADCQMETIIKYFAQNEPKTLQSIKFINNSENDTHHTLTQSFLKVMSRCPLKLLRNEDSFY